MDPSGLSDFLTACPQDSVTHYTPLVTAKGMRCLYEHACEDNVGKSLKPTLNKI